MTGGHGGFAASVESRTPKSRERYVDFLRALVVVVVVLGHWLAAVVTLNADGGLAAANIIDVAPGTQVLTWVVQVLPVFFLVGGYSNAASWAGTVERSGSWTRWLYARVRRLLLPATVFLGLVVTAAAVARAAGANPAIVRPASLLAGFLLWFLAVYIPLVALTPLAVRAHERWGLGTVAGLVLAVAAVDVLRLALNVPGVEWLNYLLVYGAVMQVGVAWRAGRFDGPRLPTLLFAGSFAAAVGLVASPAYPFSMVTVNGAAESNASPPSLALLMLGLAQAGLVLLLREPGRRLCQRPAVWTPTVLVSSRIMTIYLWQMIPLLLAAPLLVLTGVFPQAEPGSPTWWALRPLWVLALVLLFVPIVWLAGRVEARPAGRTPASPSSAMHTALAAAGVVLLTLGLSRLVLGGFSTASEVAAGVPVVPLAAYATGVMAIWMAARPPKSEGDEKAEWPTRNERSA